MMNVETCIKEGFLKRITPDRKIQKKELLSADYDLGRASSSLEESDHKWSTIQSYYAIFHAARSLLNKIGYREKRHFAVGVVLEDLAGKKKIDTKLASDFHAAISAREDADYRDVYSKETAEYMAKIAEDFVEEIKRTMKKI